ncbi:MAG: hypothetical protein EAZ97_01660, partial [Bacteroidetes bacterium]
MFFLYICTNQNKKIMARKKKKIEEEDENIGKNWQEGELIKTFNLIPLIKITPLMQEWLDAPTAVFDVVEQGIFEKAFEKVVLGIKGWSEEDLKMKFISDILNLGWLTKDDKAISYFDKTISATVEGIKLTVKSDFMLAEGILNIHGEPYFHFQEYKPNKNPKGDSMAQLIEAFLIGQTKNKRPIPLYGVEIVGKQWTFVIMEGKEYCSSESFDATKRNDLLKI